MTVTELTSNGLSNQIKKNGLFSLAQGENKLAKNFITFWKSILKFERRGVVNLQAFASMPAERMSQDDHDAASLSMEMTSFVTACKNGRLLLFSTSAPGLNPYRPRNGLPLGLCSLSRTEVMAL